jgi:hypothetical protein
MDLHEMLLGSLYFLYGDVRTSQETQLWASTACCEDGFTLNMKMMFVLHRKQLWASTAFYGDSFNFYMDMMFAPHRKHNCVPPRPVTGSALLHFLCCLCIQP